MYNNLKHSFQTNTKLQITPYGILNLYFCNWLLSEINDLHRIKL